MDRDELKRCDDDDGVVVFDRSYEVFVVGIDIDAFWHIAAERIGCRMDVEIFSMSTLWICYKDLRWLNCNQRYSGQAIDIPKCQVNMKYVFVCFVLAFFTSESKSTILSHQIQLNTTVLPWMPDACRIFNVKAKLSLSMFTQCYNCHTVYQRKKTI